MSNLDDNKDCGHNWNVREEKKPIGTYILIGILCLLLGWMLGNGLSS